MHGNVWEWCRDWYKETLPGGTDPEATEEASRRVIRGGGWDVSSGGCHSAFRSRYVPAAGDRILGFRVAAVQSSK
jgi:formylglycine-generating enzyme required for sulfatase activity